MRNKFKLKFKNKLLLLNAFGICILFIISLVLNSLVIHHYNRRLTTEIAKNLELSAETITNICSDIETQMSQLASNSKLQNYLSNRKQDKGTPSDYHSIYNLLLNTYANSDSLPYIDYIDILDKDFCFGTNTAPLNHLTAAGRKNIISLARDQKGLCTYAVPGDSSLLCCKTIREINKLSLANLGTMAVGIDTKKLIASVSSKYTYHDTKQYLFDGQNKVLLADPGGHVSKDLVKTILRNSSADVISIHKIDYLRVSIFLDNKNWHYVALVPYDQISKVRNIYIVLVCACLCLSALFLLFITSKFFRRTLRCFDSLLIDMDNGKVSFHSSQNKKQQLLARNDEIGELYRQFNHMADRINQLIHDNYAIQLERNSLQIQALSAQISPHFLYNTLDSINWRAKSIKEPSISAMVESLGKILQLTLSNPSYYLTLKEEIIIARQYLNIQTIRYKEKLTYTFHLDSDTDSIYVPRLILQPIIENAIQESMRKIDGSCHLDVSIAKGTNDLTILISNAGSRFSDDFQTRFANNTVSHYGFGIGLKNIEQRLKLCYKDKARMSFYNQNQCATVSIIIPIMIKEGDTDVKALDRRR